MSVKRFDPEAFIPASIIALRNYDLRKFVSDLIAGLTVGLVALPLAMAFAISSGVLPEAGIYTAIVAGFIISALGGSTTQIGGPTGAFVVVIAGIVQNHGIDGLFVCTLMAGVVLIVLGITGVGTAGKHIRRPVVNGFSNGDDVLLASAHIKHFCDLAIEHVPGEFIDRVRMLGEHWNTLSPAATLVSTVALVAILLIAKFVPRLHGAIVALVMET